MYERAGPPWDARCIPVVYTGYIVSIQCVYACARPYVSQTRRSCAGAHALGGLAAGRGGLSREPVRQLLTELSHPAREKDHLARRAIYLTIPPRGSSGFPSLPFSFLSLPLVVLLSGSNRAPWSPLVSHRCPRRERVGHADALRLLPKGPPRTRFGNCTRFVASSYSPCRGIFLRKAPPACTVTFLSRRSFGVRCLSLFYVPPEVMTGPRGTRAHLYLRQHRSS